MADHVGVYDVSGEFVKIPTNKPEPSVLPSGGITGAIAKQEKSELPSYDLSRRMSHAAYTYDVSHNLVPLTSSDGWGYGDWSGSLSSYTVQASGTSSYQTFLSGSGRGDVIGEFSSSHHEATQLNAYFSCSEVLDPGAISPTSVPRYYAKSTQPQPSGSTGTFSGIFITVPSGKTEAITDEYQASPDSYAVLTYITGALYAQLSASGVVSPANPSPDWFLSFVDPVASRPSGIPYIPDSYMSMPTASAESEIFVDASASAELLRQALGVTSLIPADNQVTAYLKRQGYTQATIDRWEAVRDILLQSTASGYFGS